KGRPIRVLVTAVSDELTSSIVQNLVRDLSKHDIGYVAYLREELKINPPPSREELSSIRLQHKTWLKQIFTQCDCVIMVATEHYLDYVKPKFNLKDFLHRNNETNQHHREAQKQIYSMVEKRFSKKGAASKELIPVLING
ncbi:hypothetical protein LOTGIDRAFT_176813, partial [Lottia gigantea]